MRKHLMLIGSLVVLAGCGMPGFSPMTPDMAPLGPFSWREGYVQGCDSAWGTVYVGFRKDQFRYAGEQLYRDGWDDGYRFCYAAQR